MTSARSDAVVMVVVTREMIRGVGRTEKMIENTVTAIKARVGWVVLVVCAAGAVGKSRSCAGQR
jgi:hypothetical protein